MFQLEAICKRYRRGDAEITALRPTSLSIGSGEFVAVVGPSGSGKSTLLSILGGMLAPTSGHVLFEGQSLYDLAPAKRAEIRQRKIGFLFQTFNLVPYLTALENVEVPLMLAGWCPDWRGQHANQLLERVGLADRLQHKPCELSVGQQQRVALARALANDPAVILADEPTGNLDPATRDQMLEHLQAFCRDGRTVVMVTHDPTAAACADRVLSLSQECAAPKREEPELQAA